MQPAVTRENRVVPGVDSAQVACEGNELMSDFVQHGLITTVHDLATVDREQLETVLDQATLHYKIRLVLPITAADMRAEPFARIIGQLQGAQWGNQIVVVLGATPEKEEYMQTRAADASLGENTCVLWTDRGRPRCTRHCLTPV